MVGARDWGDGGMESQCLMGTELPLEMDGGDGCTQYQCT